MSFIGRIKSYAEAVAFTTLFVWFPTMSVLGLYFSTGESVSRIKVMVGAALLGPSVAMVAGVLFFSTLAGIDLLISETRSLRDYWRADREKR